ncbi:MAG TPA: DUF5670 family protein [Bacteroidia bacterium]|nr:DUF5670 family protein [Bacteroidia bacterium]
MKKKLFNFAIIAYAIFLSSCSMMKRHYVKGYYISHNSNSLSSKEHQQGAEKKTTPPLYAVKKTPDNNVNILTPILPAENEFTSSSHKRAINKNTLVITHKKHLGYNAAKIVREEENTKLVTIKKAAPDDVVVDALSLFWIIILILLILWLVAILTGGWGLGWAIHILLVIALILLILWLLRII